MIKTLIKSRFWILALPVAFALWAPAAYGSANTPPIDTTYNNRIIDDDIALNSASMNVSEIQGFLNSKVPVCDTNHQGGLASSPPPYQCLRNYIDPTTQKSAAQLIHDEAVAVGLNPQVILVTLQKEQSLVTDTWPYPSQFRSAMGYGCPESQSVCDSDYYGFYNQVHLGARLLRAGIARNCGDTQTLPGWSIASKWGLGKSPAVDTKPTMLASCTTGSLYNYTPHRPDSAYMQNDGSTYYYGNYNFVNYFTSWFGTTWSNKLVRGAASARVYLISESRKYFIGSGDVLDAFRNLAPVRIVDQGFLDSVTAGSDLSHFVVSPSTGVVYLVDAGNKLQFNTCADVATFGGNCSNLASIPDSVLYSFLTGPAVGPVVNDERGVVYKIESSKKRVVSDLAIYHESGLDVSAPLGLTNGFLAALADGAPILKDQSINIDRDTGSVSLNVAGTLRYLPSMQLLADWHFDSLPQYRWPSSLIGQTPVGAAITPFVSDAGHTYAIDGRSKRSLDTVLASWGTLPLTTLPAGFISAVPVGSDAGTQVLDRSSGAVYIVEGGKKRLVPSGDDFTGLGLSNSSLSSLSSDVLAVLADGTWELAPLHLITTGTSGQVVMVDGSKGWKIGSPDIAAALGLDLNRTWKISQAIFDAYPATTYIGQLWSDGTNQYVIDLGKRHLLTGSSASAYAIGAGSFSVVGMSTASAAPGGMDMSRMIKATGPNVYYVEAGQKRHIQSGATYSNLSTTNSLQNVSDAFLQSLPAGPNL